jgi:hypothetical protein
VLVLPVAILNRSNKFPIFIFFSDLKFSFFFLILHLSPEVDLKKKKKPSSHPVLAVPPNQPRLKSNRAEPDQGMY